jgi:hypothetical protein
VHFEDCFIEFYLLRRRCRQIKTFKLSPQKMDKLSILKENITLSSLIIKIPQMGGCRLLTICPYFLLSFGLFVASWKPNRPRLLAPSIADVASGGRHACSVGQGPLVAARPFTPRLLFAASFAFPAVIVVTWLRNYWCTRSSFLNVGRIRL